MWYKVQLQTILLQSIGDHQCSVAQAALTPHVYMYIVHVLSVIQR